MIGTIFTHASRIRLWLGVLAAMTICSVASAQSQADETKLMKQSEVAEVIDTVLTAYEQHYVYPDTAKALSNHIRKRFKEGAYDGTADLSELTERLRNDLRSFTHDRHIYVSVMSPHDSPSVGDTITEAEIARSARVNFNIRKVEWLTGNVGYLRMDGFEDAEYAGEAVAAAMGVLARCDAIIIDLRYNGGGYETMVRFLASYFFKGPTMINSLYFTETDSLEQSWTSAYVPGKKLTDAGLYILISSRTASGAEAFSYGMKNSGRAILIGETTAGAAHWTETWEFPSLQLSVSIPIARPINPVTKTSWERTGVTPHIETSVEDALTVAHREALKELIERTDDEDLLNDLNWELYAIEAKLMRVELTTEEMLTYTGEYAEGKYAILVRDNALFWRYVDGSEFLMIPFTEDLFGFDDTDDYRLAIIRDDSGTVTGFRLLVKGREPGSIRERTGDI